MVALRFGRKRLNILRSLVRYLLPLAFVLSVSLLFIFRQSTTEKKLLDYTFSTSETTRNWSRIKIKT